jgi:hypothetical protein
MDSSHPPRASVADLNAGSSALEAAALLLNAARSSLQQALREEGEALVGAFEAASASGADSAEAARALRSAQSAHSRTGVANSAVRALIQRSDHADAAAADSLPHHRSRPRAEPLA